LQAPIVSITVQHNASRDIFEVFIANGLWVYVINEIIKVIVMIIKTVRYSIINGIPAIRFTTGPTPTHPC
jgi:hypothetical protein